MQHNSDRMSAPTVLYCLGLKKSLTNIIILLKLVMLPILWVTQGESAKIDCSHTKGAQHICMYWYNKNYFCKFHGNNFMNESLNLLPN